MRHPIVRYGLALAAVGVAGFLRGLLGAQFPGLVPFAPFFPAVLIATLLGGLGPGLLATALSAVWAWLLWLQPPAALAPPGVAAVVNLTLFVIVCLGMVATAEAARRYHDRSLAGERRFRAAEDVALDGFGILAAVRDRQRAIVDFRWAYANPALAKLLRLPGDPAGRRLLEDLPGHRSEPALFPSYVRVVETGEPVAAEVRYDADGLRGWWQTNVVRLDDGVALSLRDIGSRKEREAALQESEERFRLLADAVDDVFWIIDVRQQRVLYVSSAYERVWGGSQEQLYRDPRAWRDGVHPEHRAEVDRVFDEMLAGRRRSFELVYRMRRATGRGPAWVRDKAWLVGAPGRERIAGIMTDVSAEKAAAEQQRLLSRELDHRLRNSFALMQSIVRLSAQSADDLGAFVDALEARIQALARGQDVLMKGAGEVADLAVLVREILAPHASSDRVRIDGPTVHVAASAVPLCNMAFHELATNAAKYGALSAAGGVVSVRWRAQAGEAGPALLLTWQESGGPAVAPPQRRGFGSMLIEQALAAEFGGAIALAFPPEGAVCTMDLPLSERLMVRSDAA